jgi:hypothetical protein
MKSNSKKNVNILKGFLLFALIFTTVILCLNSCSKMADNYKPYIKNGEQIFTGKVDSLVAFPGKNRLQLRWLLVSDPKITKCKVFWNNGADSLLVPVQKSDGTDTIKVNINNLTEGLYTLDVYTYDEAGHSSVKAEVTGTVYGENYINSISNRALDSAIYYPDTKDVEIKWFGIGQGAVVMDLEYTDSLGNLVKKQIKSATSYSGVPLGFAETDTLHAFQDSTTFKYRTGYLPVDNAIDTFYTDYREAATILYVPPVIPTTPDNLALNAPTVTGGSASGNAKLTDGDRVSYWQPSSGERAGSNVWFYVDLGAQTTFNSTQLYITKDSKKIVYYEILYAKTESIGNNQTWVRAALILGDPKSENIQQFSNITGRFVKINIGLQDASSNINVGELEVYKR